jgi:transposase
MLDQTKGMHCSVCGAPYVPAGTRAAAAVAKNPTKSDRAIAEEIGVSHGTVSRARAFVSHETDDKRTGRDGRTRKMPKVR